MSIDTSKLNRYKPGYVHSNDGPGYISMLAREDGEYVRLEDVIAITIALEQALTQQRGHGEAVDRDAWAEALELPEGYTVEEFLPGGWHYAWTRADGERMVSGTTWNHPALAAIAAWQYAPDTTPHPSADAVRELVKRILNWQPLTSINKADRLYQILIAAGIPFESITDKLESLLSAARGEGVDDTKRLDWIARQGGYEFDFGILNDQPGDGDWFVHGMGGSGQGATFRDAIDDAIKEEAGGQDANTDILDTLAFKTENGDAGRGSVTYIALVASGEADHATTTPQPSADAVREYVTELRAQADQKMGVAGACAHDGDRARYKSAAQLLRRVADELESLLSGGSHA